MADDKYSILIIIGPSGAGKSTILNHIMKQTDKIKLHPTYLNTIDSVIISVLLTIIEAISTNGTDNLSVPLVFSAIIYLSK